MLVICINIYSRSLVAFGSLSYNSDDDITPNETIDNLLVRNMVAPVCLRLAANDPSLTYLEYDSNWER